MSRPAGPLRRGLGLFLVVVSVAPVHLVLDHGATGPAGRATVGLAAATQSLVWWGLLLVVALSVALTRVADRVDPGRALAAIHARLSALPAGWAVAAPALVAGGAAALVNGVLFQGYPTALDEMAHLVQARFMAAGRLAGTPPAHPPFWIIQNTLVTDAGWSSQYPPLHTAALAGGLKAGALWMVGPVLTGIGVAFAALAARRLFPGRPALAAGCALALGASPFVVVLGAGYLSHVSAAALGAAGVWAGLRARDGAASWALAAGLCAGALVATRPWTGLALSLLFAFAVWLPRAVNERDLRWIGLRSGLALLGSLPGGLWLAWYNARLFGGPLRFGYGVLQGPAHGLGFHTDPWGNAYGPLEALGYTAADLLQLGVHLFETPVPAVTVVGLFLAFAPRLDVGARVLVAWAMLPVIANAWYWHHGHHLGPRMLYESAAPWAMLTVVAVVGLIRTVPDGWPTRAAQWCVLLSVASAIALGIPGRLGSYTWSPETLERLRVPAGADGALVFVHGSWSGRLSAQLASRGMRLDSVETAIRRNDTCRVQELVDVWQRTGDRRVAERQVPLDFQPLPGNAPGLRVLPIAEGSLARVSGGRIPAGPCTASARADRYGVVELAPLVWQGDLPGIDEGLPMFVRDLGPDENERMLARYPDRPPLVFAALDEGGIPRLSQYAEAMERLWGNVP